MEIGLEHTVLARDGTAAAGTFHDRVGELFAIHFPRLYRCLDRLSGEPELAADVVQEAFVRLYARGSLPDRPEAWLISVALNLFRNAVAARSRRDRLLTLARAEAVHSDPPPPADHSAGSLETRAKVRAALDRIGERERRLLLLRAEGYSYRDLASALGLNEASVGTLLARAVHAFRAAWEDRNGAF